MSVKLSFGYDCGMKIGERMVHESKKWKAWIQKAIAFTGIVTTRMYHKIGSVLAS